MSCFIRRIKAITPGNRFLSVLLEGGASSCPQNCVSCCSHLVHEVCSPEECTACVKLSYRTRREFLSKPPPLHLSLLFTSHHPSQWSLWRTSSPSLLLTSTHLSLHLLMTASFHSCSMWRLRWLGRKDVNEPGALYSQPVRGFKLQVFVCVC